MKVPVVWYAKEFARLGWLKKFLFARTAPLTTPPWFRGYPELTGRMCQHALSCMMACPAPGAIEVVRDGKGWVPRIIKGHCIRCGLCVEACPHGVLTNGRVLDSISRDNTGLRFTFLISVNTDRCMGCGICAVACPVNKVIDKQMAYGGHAATDELLLRIDEGKSRVLHLEKCTGCQTCEEHCPNDAIHVARLLEAIHIPEETE
jgi:energy-converting hydrogenase A subunit P